MLEVNNKQDYWILFLSSEKKALFNRLAMKNCMTNNAKKAYRKLFLTSTLSYSTQKQGEPCTGIARPSHLEKWQCFRNSGMAYIAHFPANSGFFGHSLKNSR